MRTIIVTLSIFIFGATTISAAHHQHLPNLEISALALAIEQFNGGHAKNLKLWGAEHRFMFQALEAVAKADSRLEDVNKSVFPKEFKTLFFNRYLDSSSTVADVQLVNKLHKAVKKVADGCRYERKETFSFNGEQEKLTKTETSYQISINSECTNEKIKLLIELGLHRLKWSDDARVLRDIQLSLGGWQQQDMQYVRARLLELGGEVAELAEAFGAHDNSGIGMSRDIHLMSAAGNAQIGDAFDLKYFVGSGDCPSGCIFKTYYKVHVQPLLQEDGHYEFKVEVKLHRKTGIDLKTGKRFNYVEK